MSSIGSVGISAGGAMAIQYHVAHSALVSKMASVAGPPYWCAEGLLEQAVTACESEPELISVDILIAAALANQAAGTIDNTDFLHDSMAYIYTGTKDTVVHNGVIEKSLAFYQHFLGNSSNQIDYVDTIPSEHSWVTKDYGNPCAFLGSPYINNCDYDQSGIVLGFFYGNLSAPVDKINPANIISFNQALYIPSGSTTTSLSLDEKGFLYVPTACNDLKTVCRLVVVFHGCLQTYTNIGDVFYMNIGMNEWAETNNVVVLYPQAKPSNLFPENPDGCFDWWGYTNSKYATKNGPQIQTIQSMVQTLTGTS